MPASASPQDYDAEKGAVWFDRGDEVALVIGVARLNSVTRILRVGARFLATLDGAPFHHPNEAESKQVAADVALEAIGLAHCNEVGAPWVAMDSCEMLVNHVGVLPDELAADAYAAA